MRLISYLIILSCFGCHSDARMDRSDTAKTNDDACFSYPSAIDSLKMRDLYDSARWYIYTWHCDMLYKPKTDSVSSEKTFGELPLRFDGFTLSHDTLELMFNFIDKNEIILPSMTRDYRYQVTGVGFNIKRRKKIYMLSTSGFKILQVKGNDSRYQYLLPPQVLTYIRRNWNKINDCFKELAVRKGLTR